MNMEKMMKDMKMLTLLEPDKYELDLDKTCSNSYMKEVIHKLSESLLNLEKEGVLKNFRFDNLGNIDKVNEAGSIEPSRITESVHKVINEILDECIDKVIYDVNCYVKPDIWVKDEIFYLSINMKSGTTATDDITYKPTKAHLIKEIAGKSCKDVLAMLHDGSFDKLLVSSINVGLKSAIDIVSTNAKIELAKLV